MYFYGIRELPEFEVFVKNSQEKGIQRDEPQICATFLLKAFVNS